MKKQGLSSKLLKVYLFGSIFLLLFLSSINYFQFRAFSESQKLIIKSHDIKTNLQKLLAELVETDTYQRAYLISSDSVFFFRYQNKKKNIQPLLDQLTTSVEDPGQKARLDTLQNLVDSRLDYLARNLQFFSDEDQELDITYTLLFGNRLLEQIKTLVTEISEVQTEILLEKENRVNKINRASPWLLLLTVLFALLIFIVAYFVLDSYLRKVKQAIFKLQLNQEIYEQVELISNSGYWYFYPETNEITYSDNYYRLLGHEPKTFEPTLRKYLKSIVEKDRSIVITSLKTLKREGQIPSMNVKIKTPDGKEKCLHLVARLVKDENGKIIIIGSNKDLTKDIESQNKLNRLNSELQIQNNIFKNAETIAGMGSSAYNSHTGVLAFSDNLYRLLGHAPGDFEASEEKFLTYIHPQDLPNIQNNLRLKKNSSDLAVKTFRIINDFGDIKHLSTKEKLLRENGHIYIIITFKDVTEEVMFNKNLEEKNRELVKINEELDSFNHIVSHDLQEPIRKIQTFISIILEMEKLNLSPTHESYLTRIKCAALRMQRLIKDLLTFSRMAKGEKIYVKTSIKTIVENAIQELSSEIEQKNGKIHLESLPEAELVPFQFQQLFVNLIGNSIKYSREGIPPEISIRSEAFVKDDTKKHPILYRKDLVKIIIEDNGIGFDQQYAETIFILFQRLHDQAEYSGTGIGLAICKKIMDNHKGFVFAEGIPGKGSKFTLVFPKFQYEPIYTRAEYQQV
jgi:signal transduction histidine kinase/CHASE3 domain sensor protein